MTNYKPLGVLDTYARCLTHTQACRLYEAKNHKKPSKALFESIQNKKLYTFHIDSFTAVQIIGENIEDIEPQLKYAINDAHDENSLTGTVNDVVITDEGVDYMTDSTKDYQLIVNIICSLYPELKDDMNIFNGCVDPELNFKFN